MNTQITDIEVQRLAAIAGILQQDYLPTGTLDPWEGSPFNWIRPRAARQRGKIGEDLVAGWCAAKGLDVVHSPDSEADRVICGYRMEIKFSTVWASGGYTFQQIRDQNYAHLICLGVGPFDAHCWVVPKHVMWEHTDGQHGGRTGTDTHWLPGIRPDSPPEWLAQYGGSLAAAYQVLSRLRK